MAAIQDLNSITGFNGTDIIIVDDGSETQTGTITQLATYLEGVIDIPTTIADISGLETALANKANIVHTHTIGDITGLQSALDTLTTYDSNTYITNFSSSTPTITINGVSVTVGTPTSTADSEDTRFSDSVTVGNYWRIATTDGTSEEVTIPQVKVDLDISEIDNTADVDKPISIATQTALNLKQDSATAFDGEYTSLNGRPLTISSTQAQEIEANNLKQSYPVADSSKLIGIEAGADVTDTENVWEALGISSSGSTGLVLSQRGVFVAQSTSGGGELSQLITSVTALQTSVASGAGSVEFVVMGVAGSIANLSITNTNPANWVTSSGLSVSQVTLDNNGSANFTVSIPEFTDTSGSRTFQVLAQIQGEFQAAVTSDVVTQSSTSVLLNSVSIGTISFMDAGAVEQIVVVGSASQGYTLSLVEVSPAGWITSGAFSGTTGNTGSTGTDNSLTITIPSANDETVNRSFKIRATSITDTSFFVESTTITQSHTQVDASGNLSADSTFVFAQPNLSIDVNILTGDPPFTVVLNTNATDSTMDVLDSYTTNETDGDRIVSTADTGIYETISGTQYSAAFDSSFSGASFSIYIPNGPPTSSAEVVIIDGVEYSVVFANSAGTGGVFGSGTRKHKKYTITDPDGTLTTFINDNGVTDGSYVYLESIDVHALTDISYSTTSLSIGDHNLYLHISDTDGDVVIEMDTISVENTAPTASSAISSGSNTPTNGSPTTLTCTGGDIDGHALTYQWQIKTQAVVTNIADAADPKPDIDGESAYYSNNLGILWPQNPPSGSLSTVDSWMAWYRNGDDHATDMPIDIFFSSFAGSSSGGFGDSSNNRVYRSGTVSTGFAPGVLNADDFELFYDTNTPTPALNETYVDIAGETSSTLSITVDGAGDFNHGYGAFRCVVNEVVTQLIQT